VRFSLTNEILNLKKSQTKIMKKIILALFIPLVICSASYAQDTIYVKSAPPPSTPPPAKTGTEKRINLYGVWTFDDSFDSYYDNSAYYEGKIKGGFQYGAGLEFM